MFLNITCLHESEMFLILPYIKYYGTLSFSNVSSFQHLSLNISSILEHINLTLLQKKLKTADSFKIL